MRHPVLKRNRYGGGDHRTCDVAEQFLGSSPCRCANVFEIPIQEMRRQNVNSYFSTKTQRFTATLIDRCCNSMILPTHLLGVPLHLARP